MRPVRERELLDLVEMPCFISSILWIIVYCFITEIIYKKGVFSLPSKENHKSPPITSASGSDPSITSPKGVRSFSIIRISALKRPSLTFTLVRSEKNELVVTQPNNTKHI